MWFRPAMGRRMRSHRTPGVTSSASPGAGDDAKGKVSAAETAVDSVVRSGMSPTNLGCALSIPQLQIGRHLNAASRIGIIPPAARNPARTRLAAAEDRQRRYREGLRALTLECVVELRQLGQDDPGEIPVDLAELRPQRSDILELVCRGWPIPGRNRTVKLIGVLPQPFFPGNRSTFPGGDDLFPDRIQLAVKVLEPAKQGVTLRPALACLRNLLPQAGNSGEQFRLIVEQRVNLHRRLILRLAISQAPRDTSVEADGGLGFVDLVVLVKANGIGSRQHAWPLRAGLRKLRGGRDMRRAPVHGPHHAIQPAAGARGQLVDQLPV